jgi:hypothetical protein
MLMMIVIIRMIKMVMIQSQDTTLLYFPTHTAQTKILPTRNRTPL